MGIGAILVFLLVWPTEAQETRHVSPTQTSTNQSEAERPPGKEVLIPLLNWIASQTQYDTSRSRTDPPTISFCAVGSEIRLGRRTIPVLPTDSAIYDQMNRHIYLVRPWSPTRIADRGVLLHELVHDVQFTNRDWSCPPETEQEAYRLQAAWLAEHGIESGFDWAGIYLQSRCRSDIHP